MEVIQYSLPLCSFYGDTVVQIQFSDVAACKGKDYLRPFTKLCAICSLESNA